MDSPVPTLYPCLGQWDLSTPVPIILKAGQTRACCLCAGIQPHPLQSFPDAVVRAIFLTLRSDCVCLLLQCLPLGQVHAPQTGPPRLAVLPLSLSCPGRSPHRPCSIPSPAPHLCASLSPGVSSFSTPHSSRRQLHFLRPPHWTTFHRGAPTAPPTPFYCFCPPKVLESVGCLPDCDFAEGRGHARVSMFRPPNVCRVSDQKGAPTSSGGRDLALHSLCRREIEAQRSPGAGKGHSAHSEGAWSLGWGLGTEGMAAVWSVCNAHAIV